MNAQSSQIKAALPGEPAALWSTRLIVFDKSISMTQNVILSQGRYALQDLVRKIDILYDRLKYLPNLIDGYVHEEIPQIVGEICFHQGLASSIMFNDSERGNKETARSYRLRLERFKYIKDMCREAHTDVSLLGNRIIRNQIVHMDHYIAQAMKKPNTGWFVDIAIARRDQFTAPPPLEIGFCRCFIASEEIILHLDNEISVRKLRAEATSVLSIVFGTPPIPPPPPPAHSRQWTPPALVQRWA